MCRCQNPNHLDEVFSIFENVYFPELEIPNRPCVMLFHRLLSRNALHSIQVPLRAWSRRFDNFWGPRSEEVFIHTLQNFWPCNLTNAFVYGIANRWGILIKLSAQQYSFPLSSIFPDKRMRDLIWSAYLSAGSASWQLSRNMSPWRAKWGEIIEWETPVVKTTLCPFNHLISTCSW